MQSFIGYITLLCRNTKTGGEVCATDIKKYRDNCIKVYNWYSTETSYPVKFNDCGYVLHFIYLWTSIPFRILCCFKCCRWSSVYLDKQADVKGGEINAGSKSITRL